MPFKSGKSPADVARKLKAIFEREIPDDIRAGLYTMYTVLGGTADFYVPVDTSTLVKSRSYNIRRSGKKFKLTYGYYTDYAAALHENNNWLPKPPNTDGKKGGGYNPNAQFDWMNIAWNEVGDEAKEAFTRVVTPK